MKSSKLALTAAILTATLFTCEKVPDYCGTGALYDPSCQFCFGGEAYNKCGGKEYNPLTQGCIQDAAVGTRCLDGSAVPAGTPCGGYTLTIDAVPKEGGGVERSPQDRTVFKYGEDVILNAKPANADYAFAGWAGALTSNEAMATYSMKGGNPNITIAAMFKPAGRGKLIAEPFPKEGGTVARNPNKDIYSDEYVTVTAHPAPGYAFIGWSGADTSKNAETRVFVDESKTLVAVFAHAPRTLSISADPSDAGAVFVNGTALSGAVSQNLGTQITVWAVAERGFSFKNWSGTATFDDPNSENTTVTLASNETMTIIANFRQGGGGTVTPPPVVTPPDGGGDSTFTDGRDGKTYKKVTIGSQTWMAENLNYDTRDWVGSWCYGDHPNNCAKYGRLYDWATAMDIDEYYNEEDWGGSNVKHRGVCPAGWYLPTIYEWETLVAMAGGRYIAGGKLKATNGWRFGDKIGNGTDDFGFSALPGGQYNRFNDASFYAAEFEGYWWAATTAGVEFAFVLNLNLYDDVGVDNTAYYKRSGYSVRCVQDDGTTPTPATYIVTVSSAGTTSSWISTAGTMVTISAGTAPTGQVFNNWRTSSSGVAFANANSATTTFTMPSNAVTVTAVFGNKGKFTDARDNKQYAFVKIGNQTWMAENLNYATASGSWCYDEGGVVYNENTGKYDKTLTDAEVQANCTKYGRLYNWNTAMGGASSTTANPSKVRGVCPNGWHLPSRAEWDALEMAVGSRAGRKLKSATGWEFSDDDFGADNFGFSALPGGIRWDFGGFYNAFQCGYWWTATESSDGDAYLREMYYANKNVDDYYFDKSGAISVRCVQDVR
ncbi:hypothetical protein R80B4_03297 [Fibrobacteres bacterium R8-0-B4]